MTGHRTLGGGTAWLEFGSNIDTFSIKNGKCAAIDRDILKSIDSAVRGMPYVFRVAFRREPDQAAIQSDLLAVTPT